MKIIIEEMTKYERSTVVKMIAECSGAENTVWALLLLFGNAYQSAAACISAGDEDHERPLLDALADPWEARRRGDHTLPGTLLRPQPEREVM